MEVSIIRSMEFEKLIELFERSGLEIHQGTPTPEGLITCFELIEKESAKLLGASGICFQEGAYVLRCVAVEEAYRGKGYGKLLVDVAMEEARRHGAEQIWLTAKVPLFYEKFGYVTVPREKAPIKTTCGSCEQYHNGCESEVMVYRF